MSLSIGTRIGSYQIVSTLGAGGMGEVYRARDTRLNREVAIKALPEICSVDPERVARFEREAQLLAALTHANIGGIHGVEEAGGARYLILELIPGVSLAERLEAGPMPVAEALAIARQVAEALEAAHEKGIIHRDLKPGNIMVTPDGAVKVLDFGLAKALGPEGSAASTDGYGPANSPTLTLAATQLGLILGTAAYMAPEQAKGRVADKRCDVWAFGCVLFEMIAGARAFGGEDVSDTLAAVLRADPEWATLPPATPPPIERLLRRCLEKDRRKRVPDISVARFAIDDCLAAPPQEPGSATAPAGRPRAGRLATAALVVAAAGAGLGALAAVLWQRPAPAPLVRFEIVPPPGAPVAVRPRGTDIAIAPDGMTLAYRVRANNEEVWALRRLGEIESTLLPGSERINWPAFSPDSEMLAFGARRKLHTLTLGSQTTVALGDLPAGLSGMDWLNANEVVLAGDDGLFRMSTSGGAAQLIAAPPDAQTSFAYPRVLPGGEAIVFTIQSQDQSHVAVRRLDSGEQRVILENATYPQFVAPGYLLFCQGGRLMAVRFDPGALTTSGTPVVVEEGAVQKPDGAINVAVARNGTLAVVPGVSLPYRGGFVVKARDGRVLRRVGTEMLDYPRYPRVSPDGRRLAATVGYGSRGDIWVFDLAGAVQPLKLTFAGHNLWPNWTPDGKRLVFSNLTTAADGTARGLSLLELPSDASSLEPRTIASGGELGSSLGTISPDGEWLMHAIVSESTGSDLVLTALKEGHERRPWLTERFGQGEPAFSPDGRWVAYVNDQTGEAEIWVRPFPGPGSPVRLSPSGGHEPVWAKNGRELLYQQDGSLFVVEVTSTTPEFRFSAPRLLFQGGGFVPFATNTPRTYDAMPDGSLLMVEANTSNTSVVTIATGWNEYLKARFPR
jgi:eukaryotic-like serine/threonine-protein kinase